MPSMASMPSNIRLLDCVASQQQQPAAASSSGGGRSTSRNRSGKNSRNEFGNSSSNTKLVPAKRSCQLSHHSTWLLDGNTDSLQRVEHVSARTFFRLGTLDVAGRTTLRLCHSC